MRFFSAALLSLIFSTSALTSAMAAMSANDWQSQLQSQVQQLQAQSTTISAAGNVTVEDQGGMLHAILPALTVMSPDQSYWVIPSVTLQASAASDAVTLMLPAKITRYNASKAPIATMNLGAQSLTGHWNASGHYFDTLNGTIKNVTFNDTISDAKSSVGSVAVTANKGGSVQFTATDIRSATVQNQKPLSSNIAKAVIAYQQPSADKMTLLQLIGYLNPGILLAAKQEVVFTVTGEQISMTGLDNRKTSLQKLTSTFDLKPKGKTVSGTMNTQAFIVSQSPASVYGFVLPRQSDMSANISNLPIEMVSFAPGMSPMMAKSAMANAGTVINISRMNITTFDQGKVNGTGMLKAVSDTPSGFTGRLTMNIENLKDLVASNQAALLSPDAGADRSAKTQSLMAMMMLQGMGKPNGSATQFVLDLTPDGQTLVNGQDLSGLIGTKGRTKAINTVPAMPVTPVSSSEL